MTVAGAPRGAYPAKIIGSKGALSDFAGAWVAAFGPLRPQSEQAAASVEHMRGILGR
jgi:hypothetical protein